MSRFKFLLMFCTVFLSLPHTRVEGVTKTERRIISLSPALTEVIYYLKLDDFLVGVSDFSDFPEAAKAKTKVGPYTKPLYEKIVALKPTLVLVPHEGPKDVADRLAQLNIPFEVIQMRRLQDIPETMKKVATLVNEKDLGENAARDWSQQLNTLKADRIKQPTGKKVLVQLDQNPLIVAGSGTFLNEIVELCGSRNIYADKAGYPKISLEASLKNKVDVILALSHFETPKEKASIENFWKALPPFKKTPVKFVDPDSASRPGPRLIEGARLICKALEE